MEDSKVVNGGVEDQEAESFFDPDHGQDEVKNTDPNSKIGVLDEKVLLIRENQEIKEKFKKLSLEMEQLRRDEQQMKERLEAMEREVDQSDEEKSVLESIAARSMELETEVSRLQHDLMTSMNEVDESNREIEELKKDLGEKGLKIESLEREIESFKKGKAENEKKVRDLERKLGLLEMKEMEEKSKKMRVEEEMRERIDEKEKEIRGLKKKVDDLENEVAKSRIELEKQKTEKKLLEETLRGSKERVSALELKLLELHKEAEEAGRLVTGVRERSAEHINGKADEIVGEVDDEEPESKGLHLRLQLGSAGVVVLAAVVAYFFYSRRT